MAADGQIRIIVSAGLSRDVEATFGTIEKMAERTGRVVQKALGGGSNAGATAQMGRGFRAAASESDKASKQIESDFAKQIKAAEKASNAEYKAFEKAGKDRIKFAAQVEREIDKGLMRETRAAEREADKQAKTAERASKRVEAEHQRFASRVSQRSVRFLFPNPIGAFGMASRIGGDILRGAGIDMSISGSVGRAVNTQALATQLSSQGYMKGHAGPNGTRVSAATLEAEARANAASVSGDPEQMLRAQTKFVDITGNLDDARKAMPDIGKLSVATGTDPEKMAEAWANVSRHMGDIPNKAEKVRGLMQLIAGEGRVGSIEIKDEAKDLGKIAAMADKYGGDRAASIGKLATLAQLGKAEGGSASSAQAATSIVSFTNTFSSAPRLKAMFAAGLKEADIFNMTGTGKNAVRSTIKDPFEIIKKVLDKTGGDITKFGGIFKSVMSQRATNALTSAYNSGGGRNMAAVDAKISEFGKESALTDDQVKENVDAFKNTDKAKAQEFQNALDGVISETKNELTPALVALKDPALQAAHYLSEMVGWAAKNPLQAVGVAITAAITRAIIEAGFRSVVEKMVTGAASAGGINMIAPVAITIAAATIAMHLIDEDIKDKEKAQRDAAIANGQQGELENEAKGNASRGIFTKKGQTDLEVIDANLEGRIKRAQSIKDLDAANGGAPTGAKLALETMLSPERGLARLEGNHLEEMKHELADNKRILEMMRTGNLRVTVTNADEIARASGPKVYAAGRQAPVGDDGVPNALRR